MSDITADRPAPALGASPPSRDPLLRGWELAVGVGALGLVSFVGVLDLTVANVILPTIASTYSASPHEVTMAITCFAAAQAVATPVTGWLSTRYGVIRVFVLSLIGFAIASMLCGMAPSLDSFVAARVLQGFTAGPMLPIVQTLLQRSVPKPRLGAAIAFWAVVMSSGPLVGPILGGIFADSIGWPWAFYMNLPFLAVAILVIIRIFGDRETPTMRAPLDWVGLLLLTVWVGALQFALDKGADNDWFESPMIVMLALVAAIGFVAFLIWEFTDAHPLIDFSVFRYRSFLFGTPVSTISYSSLVVANLLLTLWAQFAMGYTSTWAGYAVATMGLSSIFAGPICAILTKRLDPRFVISFFMTLTVAGFLWRSTFTGNVDFWKIATVQVCTGLTTTAAMGPIFAMVMGDIPHPKLPGAAGLLTFVRMLAVGVLTAILTTMWTNGQSGARTDMAGSLHATARGLDPFRGAEGLGQQGIYVWNEVVSREAITLSTQHVMVWVGLYVMLAPILIWFCPRPKPVAGAVVTPME